VRRYDKNRNGVVDAVELLPLLREMGLRALPEEVVQWLRQVLGVARNTHPRAETIVPVAC
jgi:Ca2+-binding EF-hand superfamily protein